MEIIISKRYPVYSPLFWASYVVQMRPYLLFVSGIAGLSGIAMAGGNFLNSWKPVVASLFFFFAYGFGQALTDCFQTDTDKLSAPYRPLSRDIISVSNVFSVSLFFLSVTGFLLYIMNPVSFWLSVIAVGGLATYSYVKKKFGIAGPFYNAWIVALLPLMGFFACSATDSFSSSNIVYVLISFFSYANFVLIGYLKDIDADKATGYKTFPVVLGWEKTILAGDAFALITLIASWAQPVSCSEELTARILASVIIITGQMNAHFTKEKNEKGATFPIIATVRGFILMHVSIILHFQPGWLIFLILFYCMFEVALYKRPCKNQV